MRIIAAGLACVLLLGEAHAAEVSHHVLPDGFTYPEGIALESNGNAFYTASAENGAVIRVELASGRSRVVVPEGVLMKQDSPFPGLLGLKLDTANRLWIAGGRTDAMVVVDARSGDVIRRFQSPRAGGLINDVVVTRDAAYFTDSFNPVLWRVPIKGTAIGELEPWLDLNDSPIRYAKGVNLNGIALTPDDKQLIVVQMDQGLLYRIDIASKHISPIDAGGAALSGGDGLVLDGNMLYVVRQTKGEVVALELSSDGNSAKAHSTFSDPALKYPATAVRAGDRLLVVNTQFDRHDGNKASVPFDVVGIPLGALKRK
jgi:sugar lactone lactonase YvrE